MLILIAWFIISLPLRLFLDPTSTAVFDKNGELLGAKISEDGQWRFSGGDTIPEKFEKSLLTFEDEYFYKHPGFNPISLGRAMKQNFTAHKTISGGSTITMQVIRLWRKNKKRTIAEKLIEIILSARLELTHSKKNILNMYVSNAPFGGNVIGLEAASWRYFGRGPKELSWAENALLAVLPNSPSLVHPGKNRKLLLTKRDNLLNKLYLKGIIDSRTLNLSKSEILPDKPFPLPQLAKHLIERIAKEKKGQNVITTIDANLQIKSNEIIEYNHNILLNNDIQNISALIIDVETNNILVYIGNTNTSEKAEGGNDVDIVCAARSTGSILKPILFASCIEEGEILQNSLIPDIPTRISGFAPKNYSQTYDGAVPAKKALSRSLNIPSVKLLQNHGVEKFHYLLQKIGLTSLTCPPNHYGLSLILGGAEGKLWDLTGIYASMSRVLNHFTKQNGYYSGNDFKQPNFYYSSSNKNQNEKLNSNKILSACSIWFTYQSLLEVNRPEEDANWTQFSSSQKIAWKTGTSFGNRDGWAIGTTPKYAIGVWVGNADGEGKPLLTGIATAAPIMFELFKLLPKSTWFSPPYDEMTKASICRKSGYRTGPYCEENDSVLVYTNGLKCKACPFHYLIHLSSDEKYRVNSDCEPTSKIVHKSWFILPPAQEYYFKSKNAGYNSLPPLKPGCNDQLNFHSMEFIYPHDETKVYIPYTFDGSKGQIVIEVAHRKQNVTIYWSLDEQYIGSTRQIHQMAICPSEGYHTITLVDETGEILVKKFEVIDKKETTQTVNRRKKSLQEECKILYDNSLKK
jgi:penicillin-binding protein 1C